MHVDGDNCSARATDIARALIAIASFDCASYIDALHARMRRCRTPDILKG